MRICLMLILFLPFACVNKQYEQEKIPVESQSLLNKIKQVKREALDGSEHSKNMAVLDVLLQGQEILKKKHSKGVNIEAQAAVEHIGLMLQGKDIDTNVYEKAQTLSNRLSSFAPGSEKNESYNEVELPEEKDFIVLSAPKIFGNNQIPDDITKSLSSLSFIKSFFTPTPYTCNGVVVSDPDPFGASVSSSDHLVNRTSSILALAQQLDSPENIFNYVRREIKPWLVAGATQSAEQVLRTRKGTFADKATLLISLFRARGIPAQYLFGETLVSENKLKGIYGVEGANDLYWAMLGAGVPDYWSKVVRGGIYYRGLDRYWMIPHTWVRAYINGNWVQLDPSDIYYDFGLFSPLFRNFDYTLDFDKYLIGQDTRGKYEKSGTVLDFLLESIDKEMRDHFGSGVNYRNLDLNSYGEAVLKTEELPTGTMGYNGEGCVLVQSDSLPSSHERKYHLKISRGTNVLFDQTFNVSEVAEKGIFTAHSAGLYRRAGSAPGELRIYFGDSVVGSFSASTQESLGLDYSLEYYPKAYSNSNFSGGNNLYTIQRSGDVYAFMAYAAPQSAQDLNNAIVKLKNLQEQSAPENIRYAQLLRIANIFTVIKENEESNLSDVLHGVRNNSFGLFYTFGSFGLVRDRLDRPFGIVPTGAGFNWNSMGYTYSRSGNFTNYDRYKNLSKNRLVNLLSNSHIEAIVWEILYGIPGGSSTKLLQVISNGIHEKGQPDILIKNQQMGIGNDANIFASFDKTMRQVLDFSFVYGDFIKEKGILYSHKTTYTDSTGYNGRSLLVLPTSPRGTGLALYGGEAPFGKGGGVRGGPVDAQIPPSDLSRNDTSLCSNQFSRNPVSYATGDMFHEFKDIEIKGRTDRTNLFFKRKYSSNPYNVLGDLGPNWSHNFQTRLLTKGYTSLRLDLPLDIVWIKEEGDQVVFTRLSDGTYISPKGIFEKLIIESSDVRIIKKNGDFYSYAKQGSGVTAGKLNYMQDVYGEKVELTYDSSMRLIRAENTFTGALTFSYDSSNRIILVHKERDRLSYQYSYGPSGYLQNSSDFDNNNTSYAYVSDRAGTKAQNLLNEITDPLGYKISFEYYNDGKVFKEIGKGQAETTYFYSYYLVNHITRVRGEDGSTRVYSFDDNFRLIETAYEDGSRIKKYWDNDSNLVLEIDELGYRTEYMYDSLGNNTGIKYPEHSDFIRFEYDNIFNKVVKVVPRVGSSTFNDLDEGTGDYIRTRKQDSFGSVFLEFQRDMFGNILATRNNEATYVNQRDSNGFLTRLFDSRNPIDFDYDSRGRVVRKSWSSGKELIFIYDNFDRLVQVNNNLGPDTTNHYDVLGRLISQTISDGTTSKITQYEYDERDRTVAIVDPLMRRKEFKYDLPGLGCKLVNDAPREIIDFSGQRTKLLYDSRNRLIRKIAPDGTVTRMEYNDRGDLTGITDGIGNRTVFVYDGNHRVIRKERVSSKSTVGDGDGNIQSLDMTYFKYNEADQLIREEKFSSDESNGTEVTKLVIEYGYNQLGQRVSKVVKKEFMGNVDILDEASFSYARLLDAPYLLTANNSHLNLNFSFEALPPFALTQYSTSPVEASNPLGLISGIFSVEPDDFGGIKSITDNEHSLKLVENVLDGEGKLQKKVSKLNNQTLTTNLNYNSFSQVSRIAHSNGLEGLFSYDILNRISGISWSGANELFSESMTYNPSKDIITQIQRDIGILNFGYNDKNELTTVAFNGDSSLAAKMNRTLSYDNAGNRINDTFSGVGLYTGGVIEEDQLYTYNVDPNGYGQIVQKTNKLTGSQRVFEYLDDGKIRKLTKLENVPNSRQVASVDYYYDALGRRIAKHIKTISRDFTETYMHQGLDDKILLAKSGLGEMYLYVDGNETDQHFGEIRPSQVKTYVTDHLGTVVNSEVLPNKITGIFGEVLAKVDEPTEYRLPVQYAFTGREYDSESNLYYYRNRYYDPESGRFMSIDPLGIRSGDVNLYRYVSNNPASYSDPFGLAPGDIYRTEQEAGTAVINDINISSILISREIGGTIYLNNGGYSYTTPVVLGSSSGNISIQSNSTAIYHTHGSNDPGYDNNNFSSRDIQTSRETGLNMYLGTPDGQAVQYFNPFSGGINRCNP